jgi:hypothetical protein
VSVNPENSVFLVTGSDPNNQQFGTAFAFYRDEDDTLQNRAIYLLTCRHVVTDVGGPDRVKVGSHPATVVARGSEDGLDDLAVLRVEDLYDVPILELNTSAKTGTPVKVLGFRSFPRSFLVRPLRAQLGERVGLETRLKPGRVVAWDLTIEDDYDLEQGYSGGPVVNEESGGVVAVANYRLGGRKGVALSVEILEKIWPTALDKMGTLDKEATDYSRPGLGTVQDDPSHTADEQKPLPTLPTFEIGKCTRGSPFEMQCTGEIVGGLEAAKRVVEEIELYTSRSDPRRFAVRVAGIERHREYLSRHMSDASGADIEERHKSRMALLDWEKHLSVFCSGVEFVLWNETLRSEARIYDSEGAAETICGLSAHCFNPPRFPVEWWLWYEGERQTRRVFGVTEDIEKFMRNGYYEDDFGSFPRRPGLPNYRALALSYFGPHHLHQYVLPRLLIFAAEKKAEGASQATIDRYLDVTRWRWSVSHPDEVVK